MQYFSAGYFLIFQNPPLFYTLFPTFFHFMGGSIETIASIAEQRVLNLNLTDGSKTKCCRSIAQRGQSIARDTPQCVGLVVGMGVQMVLCNSLVQ